MRTILNQKLHPLTVGLAYEEKWRFAERKAASAGGRTD